MPGGISLPFCIASCAMIACIWGASLVPGTGSSTLSLSVVDGVRSMLDALGLGGPRAATVHGELTTGDALLASPSALAHVAAALVLELFVQAAF